MEHQKLYKTLSRGDGRDRSVKNREIQAKTRSNRRADALQQNRQITVTPTKPESPQPSTSRQQPRRNAVKQPQNRLARIQELRSKKTAATAGKKEKVRSPFITAVPVGRIVPAKRDVVEEKMKKFREASQSATKRRSVTSTVKRRSGARKAATARAVIAKPVALLNAPRSAKKRSLGKKKPTKEVKKPEQKEEPVVATASPVTKSPKAGPSTNNIGYYAYTEEDGAVGGEELKEESAVGGEEPKENAAVGGEETEEKGAVDDEEPEATLLGRCPFAVPVIPPLQEKPQVVPDTPQFNKPFSFLTSTAHKSGEKHEHLLREELDFLEGISPLEKTVAAPSKTYVSDEPNLDSTFSTDEEKAEIPATENLNSTFETDEIESPAYEPEVMGELSKSATKTVLRSLQKDGATVRVSLDLPVIEHPRRKRSRSGPEPVVAVPRKSQRVSSIDMPVTESRVQNEVADHHYGVVNTETNRLKIKIEEWDLKKSENAYPEAAIGMIDTAIGQTELLLRKKFMKFRELIGEFEKNERGVRPDDLEGYWEMVTLEVQDLDRRYAELDAYSANDWRDPVKSDTKPKVTKIRKVKKNPIQATSTLKSLVKNIRAKLVNRVSPVPTEFKEEVATLVELEPVVPLRLHNTPKRNQPKRRSTNCSGCTPSSHRKSAKKSVAFSPEESASKSSRRATRNSVRKISFQPELKAESARTTSRKKAILAEQNFNQTLPESILKDDTKSAVKRATKSVLFAVAETPELGAHAKKPRIAKTPRFAQVAVLNAIENDGTATPPEVYKPVDDSNVTKVRGSRSSRTKKSVVATADDDDSPITAIAPARETRRSKRLFS